MTMRVKIENLGPECYATVVTNVEQPDKVIELLLNQSVEVYVYPGNTYTISEKNVENK